MSFEIKYLYVPIYILFVFFSYYHLYFEIFNGFTIKIPGGQNNNFARPPRKL